MLFSEICAVEAIPLVDVCLQLPGSVNYSADGMEPDTLAATDGVTTEEKLA